MPTTLTTEHRAIIDKRVFAFVTTLMPDGSPQTTPVWVDHDGEHLLFNTARGRLKTRNLERDPRLSVAMVDPDDPYAGVLTIRGRAELIDEGGEDHIHRLSQKYTGQDFPGLQPGVRRVTVRVIADRVGDGS